jgi:hypothetical protein
MQPACIATLLVVAESLALRSVMMTVIPTMLMTMPIIQGYSAAGGLVRPASSQVRWGGRGDGRRTVDDPPPRRPGGTRDDRRREGLGGAVGLLLRQCEEEDDGDRERRQTPHDEDGGDDDALVLEDLQNQLTWIEAIEERNLAQLESFIDERHQWESLETAEQDLLSRKQSILDSSDDLTKKLLLCKMKGKQNF